MRSRERVSLLFAEATRTQTVQLRGIDGSEATGTLRVRGLSPRERALRGWKLVCLLWGLAIVSVIIPVAHFVLVPGLLLAGCIAGPAAYRTRELFVDGAPACPHCAAALVLRPGPVRWPHQETCAGCGWAITIAPVASSL